jgi:hypothetical protein
MGSKSKFGPRIIDRNLMPFDGMNSNGLKKPFELEMNI